MKNRRTTIRRRMLLAGASTAGLVVFVSLLWLSTMRPGPVASRQDDEALVSEQNASPAKAPPSLRAAADEPDPLWVEVDETTASNPPPYAPEWSMAGRALVRVAAAASTPGSWQVGDRLVLPLPQLGETYHLEIEEIDEAVGSRALLGRIADDAGRLRRCVVTLGPSSLFAYIDTPEGSFELVANHEFGWLLPSSSMVAGWDFSEPDYVLAEDMTPPDGRP